MKELAKTEQELRDAKVPWPKTKEELMEYVDSLVERGHEYGTCPYAMSMAAVATFYYVSHKLGATGAQAGWADLDFLKRTRGYDCGFRIIDYSNLLYPQYLDDEHFPSHQRLLIENIPTLSKKAKEILKKGGGMSENVKRRLTYVASLIEDEVEENGK